MDWINEAECLHSGATARVTLLHRFPAGAARRNEMSSHLMPVRALLLSVSTVLIVTGSPVFLNAQWTKNPKPCVAAVAPASRPGIESLCPLLAIGICLFAASSGGFIAAAVLERASRSAMHIARASRVTLLACLAVLLMYCLSVSYLVLFR
jgi:hypothetical protein